MQASTSQTPRRSYWREKLAERALLPENATPFTVDRLLHNVSHLPEPKLKLIEKAYTYADEAHSGQVRQTGHPYITHPLAVAGILSALHVDAECIIAGLLHDVLEDTHLTKDTLLTEFGREVAEIVNGVSNLNNVDKSDREARQAENFQFLIDAAADDLRVIFVKLVDRLHNMRTIGVLPSEKGKRIARETMAIYASIADKLGIHTLKNELEDLSFEVLHPIRADHITYGIDTYRDKLQEVMPTVHAQLEDKLEKDNIPAKVLVHRRHLYSIYREMSEDKKLYKDVEKVYAFDILVEDELNCYKALGSVHTLFRFSEGAFKDYISCPKPNGYQSLHTSIFNPDNISINLYIRTERMHVMAQRGVLGQLNLQGPEQSREGLMERYIAYLQELNDMRELSADSKEFYAMFKHDHSTRDITVYTPQNKSVELPTGSTALDFAYAIHTEVGHTAVSCTINQKEVSLTTPLESGQTIEIITEPGTHPSPSWLSHVNTAKARVAIQHLLRKLERHIIVDIGEKLLKNKLAQVGKDLDSISEEHLNRVCEDLNIKSLEDLYDRLGQAQINPNTVLKYLETYLKLDFSTTDLEIDGAYILQGVEGATISYGKCCGPVPGDPVFAQRNADKGWIIHVQKCKNVQKRRSDQDERLPVRWSEETKGEFETSLHIEVVSSKNEVVNIVNALNQAQAGLSGIDVTERTGRFVTVVARLLVRDRNHLKNIFNQLKNKPYVQSVARPEGDEITWQAMPSKA